MHRGTTQKQIKILISDIKYSNIRGNIPKLQLKDMKKNIQSDMCILTVIIFREMFSCEELSLKSLKYHGVMPVQ